MPSFSRSRRHRSFRGSTSAIIEVTPRVEARLIIARTVSPAIPRAPYTARKDKSDFVGAPQSSLSYYHTLKQDDEAISRAGLRCANGVAHEFFGLCQRLGC